MRAAALFSGGKDSTYALFCALQQGFDVTHLLTLEPEPDSMMFHYPNIPLTSLQAKAIGIPAKKTKTKNERELEDLSRMLAKLNVDAVVSGAVESEYQKQRIDVICEELGLRSFAPLWRKEPLSLLREMLAAGFEIIVTAVAADGFGKDWLGRILDETAIEDLASLQSKHNISPILEGGEGETFVRWAPFFKKRIVIEDSESEWSGRSGVLEIRKAKLS